MSDHCVNHAELKAVSVCHSCLLQYCRDCLTEGKTYYYCDQPACQASMEENGDELSNPISSPGDSSKLVTVAKYCYPYEADLAKSRLEAEGIRAFAADEHIVRLDWFYSNAVGGIRVQVAEHDAELAKEILAADFSQESEGELSSDFSEE
jgi:hypothetical protein